MNIIIGKGNLGVDLQVALKDRSVNSVMESAGQGFEWPESEPHILSQKPECIWVTAGKGSVESAKDPWNLEDSLKTHTFLPISMALALPKEIRLVFFSSDYVADEADTTCTAKSNPRPRSLYACTKMWMEQGITMMKRPNTAIVRVGTLYGHHFPERCFPGKLKLNYPRPGEVFLPQNLVTPTPTWWAARMLVQNAGKLFSDQGTLVHHLAPIGNIPVVNWGRKILGQGYEVFSKGFDASRPHYSNLGCSLGKPNTTWEKLWEQHQHQQAQNAVGHRVSGP